IPSNTAMNLSGSKWTLTANSGTTSLNTQSQTISITGGTQTQNFVPAAIRITAGPGAVAYADIEVAAQVGQGYFQLNTVPASAVTRVCQTSSGRVCWLWANAGGSCGSSFPVTTPVTVNSGGSITATGTGSITATSGGNPSSTTSIVQALGTASGSTLIGAYLMLPGETPASLIDYSVGGVGPATATVGTAPTSIAVTGGINCTGNGAVILPAALTSNGAQPAKTMYFYTSLNTT